MQRRLNTPRRPSLPVLRQILRLPDPAEINLSPPDTRSSDPAVTFAPELDAIAASIAAERDKLTQLPRH